MRILFITANRVGDAVLTTGLLSWLEKTYPQARFTIACGPYGADLFRAVPRLDKQIILHKQRYRLHWAALWQETVGTRWDLIVDLRNSIVSRLLWAKRRAILKRAPGDHKVVENGKVLGLSPPPDPFIWVTPEAEQQAASLVPTDRPVLALAPAANWPLKQWPLSSFAALVERLIQTESLRDAVVLILADGREREQITPLLQAVPEARRIEIIGYDLQVAAACLKRARLFVGNDSGLMHLSAATGVPTLGLFGPGFPDIYGPWGPSCAFVRTPESRDALLATLTPETKTLMGSLTVEAVFDAACRLLTRGPA